MTPVNIQRDGLWIEPNASNLQAWSTELAITNSVCWVSGPTSVHVDKANVQSDHTATVSVAVGNERCIGVHMQQPVADNTPYRIKASISSPSEKDYDVQGSIVVGFSPASITGSDDIMSAPYYIPFHNTIDEMIMVPALDSGDPNYGRSLCIAVAIQPAVAYTTQVVLAQLSVQNLAVKAPTMQYSVA